MPLISSSNAQLFLPGLIPSSGSSPKHLEPVKDAVDGITALLEAPYCKHDDKQHRYEAYHYEEYGPDAEFHVYSWWCMYKLGWVMDLVYLTLVRNRCEGSHFLNTEGSSADI
ncbi:hypothetical protein KAR91_43965 [Candidatus Pacearchaeota archaeon]|nr:hypothetical protein [Candidatus Pacearchaeota archaeon]